MFPNPLATGTGTGTFKSVGESDYQQVTCIMIFLPKSRDKKRFHSIFSRRGTSINYQVETLYMVQLIWPLLLVVRTSGKGYFSAINSFPHTHFGQKIDDLHNTKVRPSKTFPWDYNNMFVTKVQKYILQYEEIMFFSLLIFVRFSYFWRR